MLKGEYLHTVGIFFRVVRYHQKKPVFRVHPKEGIRSTVVERACWRMLMLTGSLKVTLILKMEA